MKTFDVAVLLTYLVGIVAFGSWFARRTKTTEAFIAAGRSVPGWAVGLSIFGSYISSISFLANPGKSFAGNWNAMAFTLATPVAAIVAVRWFVPFYRRLGNISAYEHLEHRFGNWARTYAVVCYLLSQMARTGTIMYLLALAVSPLLGWEVTTIILITAALMTTYTVLGGMEAVIWTGVVQGVVLMIGPAVCVYYLLAGAAGGAAEIVRTAAAHGKFSLGDTGPSLSNSTFWVVLVYGLVINLQNFSVDQGYVQRYITARSDVDARRSVWLGALLYVPVAVGFFFIGTGLWVYYQQHPSALGGLNAAGAPDKVFPHFIVHELPTGLTGLVIAAIFAAAMDSSLNSMATLSFCDIYKRYFRPRASERESMRLLHLLTLVWGVAATGVAMAMVKVHNALDMWWDMAGLFGGGVLGLFLLGRLAPRASRTAAIAAVVSGVCVILAIHFCPASVYRAMGVEPLHKSLAIVLGTLAVLGVGLLVSLIAPAPPRIGAAADPCESNASPHRLESETTV